MSGLVCLTDCIFNLKDLYYVQQSDDKRRFFIKLVNGNSLIISDSDFTLLQSFILSDRNKEIERLNQENKHLRGIIASLPGSGEDFMDAKLDFEKQK